MSAFRLMKTTKRKYILCSYLWLVPFNVVSTSECCNFQNIWSGSFFVSFLETSKYTLSILQKMFEQKAFCNFDPHVALAWNCPATYSNVYRPTSLNWQWVGIHDMAKHFVYQGIKTKTFVHLSKTYIYNHLEIKYLWHL